MTEGIDRLRAGVVEACRELAESGLVDRVGRERERAGRRSRPRHADGRAARDARAPRSSPSSTSTARSSTAPLLPTSELPLHLAVYRNFDAGAVVHTHPPMATAVACVADELPCIHYTLLTLGGSVRVAPYVTFGTAELAATAWSPRCKGAPRRSWAATAPSPTGRTSARRWPRPSCSSGRAASTSTPAPAAPPACSTRMERRAVADALATYGDIRVPPARRPRPPPRPGAATPAVRVAPSPAPWPAHAPSPARRARACFLPCAVGGATARSVRRTTARVPPGPIATIRSRWRPARARHPGDAVAPVRQRPQRRATARRGRGGRAPAASRRRSSTA